MENKITQNLNFSYKTKDLNFLQKLMQMYWMNPKSWLLDEFKVSNNTLKVTTRKGNSIEAPLDKITAKYAVDNYDRHEVYLKDSIGNKLHFKEISGMLEDEQWEHILSVLPLQETKLNKIISATKSITNLFKD